MYRVVIIEDDLLSVEVLKDIISTHFTNYEVVGVFFSVNESIEKLANLEFELMLLDMELGDGLGFEILSKLEEIDFEVIITTMHNTFMLEAIKHSALDYLTKPILKEDLSIALNRFENKQEKLLTYKKSGTQLSRLVIPNQSGLLLIEIKDIVRLESDGAYTKIFMSDSTTHLASKNLGFYESQLKNNNFSRVHNKHLVNIYHMKNYIKGEGGTLLMSDGSKVEVSRRKKEEFLRDIEN